MRKIIFVLLVLFCFAEIKAQNTDQPKTYKTSQKLDNEEHSETIDAKRVELVGAKIDSILVLATPKTTFIADNTVTVSTETDTLSMAFARFYDFGIYSVDDTIQVSLDNTSWSRLLPAQSVSYKNLSATSIPQIFVKRKGTVGTCTYDYDAVGY